MSDQYFKLDCYDLYCIKHTIGIHFVHIFYFHVNPGYILIADYIHFIYVEHFILIEGRHPKRHFAKSASPKTRSKSH